MHSHSNPGAMLTYSDGWQAAGRDVAPEALTAAAAETGEDVLQCGEHGLGADIGVVTDEFAHVYSLKRGRRLYVTD